MKKKLDDGSSEVGAHQVLLKLNNDLEEYANQPRPSVFARMSTYIDGLLLSLDDDSVQAELRSRFAPLIKQIENATFAKVVLENTSLVNEFIKLYKVALRVIEIDLICLLNSSCENDSTTHQQQLDLMINDYRYLSLPPKIDKKSVCRWMHEHNLSQNGRNLLELISQSDGAVYSDVYNSILSSAYNDVIIELRDKLLMFQNQLDSILQQSTKEQILPTQQYVPASAEGFSCFGRFSYESWKWAALKKKNDPATSPSVANQTEFKRSTDIIQKINLDWTDEEGKEIVRQMSTEDCSVIYLAMLRIFLDRIFNCCLHDDLIFGDINSNNFLDNTKPLIAEVSAKDIQNEIRERLEGYEDAIALFELLINLIYDQDMKEVFTSVR